MRLLIVLLLWCLLLYLCWPLAILLVVAIPVVWVLILPFRIAKMVIEALFALLRGVLFLPARAMGVGRVV